MNQYGAEAAHWYPVTLQGQGIGATGPGQQRRQRMICCAECWPRGPLSWSPHSPDLQNHKNFPAEYLVAMGHCKACALGKRLTTVNFRGVTTRAGLGPPGAPALTAACRQAAGIAQESSKKVPGKLLPAGANQGTGTVGVIKSKHRALRLQVHCHCRQNKETGSMPSSESRARQQSA